MPTPNPATAQGPITKPAKPGVTAKITLPIVQRTNPRIIVRTEFVRRSAIKGVSTVPGTENPSSKVPDNKRCKGYVEVAAKLADHRADVATLQAEPSAIENGETLISPTAPGGRLVWLALMRERGRPHGAIIPGLALV